MFPMFVTSFSRSCMIVSALACALFVSNAFAWGEEGHAVIAELAIAKLTPNAKVETDRLLALEPGATLAAVASWADEHRGRVTSSWHYVNFPRDVPCVYHPERDCPSGNCVVAAIEKQLSILLSNATDVDRLRALKYLVHFMGDVHQPLHAGYSDDKGGNTYQVRDAGRGTNLHALWDSKLIRNTGEDVTALSTRLLASPVPPAAADLSPARAAEESCQIVRADGFYSGREVSAVYYLKFTPVMEDRLALAGARLAGALNAALK